MIKKIHKIHYKSFYEYDVGVEFRRVNLIYGWNGAGKSSFKQFLVENRGNIAQKFECSNEEYEIFVFDENYKRNTLYINDDDQNNFGSFYVGDEIRSIIEGKNKFLQKINKAEEKIRKIRERLQRDNKEKDELKKRIASNAREILSKVDSKRFPTPQSYTKADIKDDLFEKAKVLSPDELFQKQQHQLDKIPPRINLFQFTETKKLESSLTHLRDLLKQTPENEAIERLKNDSQLENFAQMALNIKARSSGEYDEKCPLCEQSVVAIKLWENLEKHFNREYAKLVERIKKAKSFFQTTDGELEEFKKWINKNLTQEIILDQKINIDDLRQKHLNAIAVIQGDIKNILKTLEEKLRAPSNGQISLEINNQLLSNLRQILSDEIGEIASFHNEKQEHYRAMIDQNIEEIKQHFIAKSKEEFNALQRNIQKQEKNILRFKKYLSCCQEEIEQFEQNLKKADKSLLEINNDLQRFFGLNEIRFERISDSQYKIQRQNCQKEWFDCKSGLSEGEKTIISIIYFVRYCLAKIDMLSTSCPIVIFDDPITSLDSRHQDMIKSYILERVIKNRGQFFILSHDQTLIVKFKEALGKNDCQVVQIGKNKLQSRISLDPKLEHKDEISELYRRLKDFTEGKVEIEKRSLRDFLEMLFGIVFINENSDFTKSYNNLLDYLGMEKKYSAKDIHELNHTSSEDHKPELPNKAKFVVEIFETLLKKIKS